MQPTPDGGAADVGHDAAGDRLAADVGAAESGQRQPGLMGNLARQGLDGDHHVGGKAPRAARPGLVAESGETPFEGPLVPFADDLAWRVQAFADRLVRQAVGRRVCWTGRV